MRKFKLRNGMVVQEKKTDITVTIGEYSDDFIITDYADNDDEVAQALWSNDDYICLLLSQSGEGYPSGGEYGTDYDIVEEINE